jgi:hypothetical protein
MNKNYVCYGPGFSGDHDSLDEAQAVIDHNKDGAVYIRMDHYEAMRVNFSAMKEYLAAQWIPVEVRLPEDCVRVLICTDQGHVCEASHHKRATQWQTPDGMFYHTDTYQHVTHWRPLPEPPEASA